MNDTPLYQVSRNTLHDLAQCARLVVGQLQGEAMKGIVAAICEADDELKRRDAASLTPAAPKE